MKVERIEAAGQQEKKGIKQTPIAICGLELRQLGYLWLFYP